MIDSLYSITGRMRTHWDCETLLMMAIARDQMQHKAKKADCEQPYEEESLSTEDLYETNESVVGSFFERFKGA